MEFEQIILTALQTKYTGVDAKTLGRIAKAKAKTATTAEEAKTIADGITLQQIIDYTADARATEATQTAVRNYENKHKLKDGKPVEEPQSQPNNEQTPPEDVPAWAKRLIEDNKTLRAELTGLKQERTANTRLEQFKAAIAAAPDKIRARFEKDFSRLTFKDDDDFNAYLEEIKPDIAEFSESPQPQPHLGITPPLSGGKPTGQASDTEVDAVVDKFKI